jgi:hypothetical protein
MMKISQKPREDLLKTQPKKKNTKYATCSEKMKSILKSTGIFCKQTRKLHTSSRNPHWWSISMVAILEIAW